MPVVIAPFILLIITARSDPGVITSQNVKYHLKKNNFDYILYLTGRECSTCHIEKPARSKHCSLCDICIGNLDHHCPFVNNCIGGGNIHLFILFLTVNIMYLFYGWYLTYRILSFQKRLYKSNPIALNRLLSDANLIPLGSEFYQGWRLWPTLALHNRYLGAIHFLCVFIGIVVLGFLLHHIYLLAIGCTTNESAKWADIDDWLKTGEIVILDFPYKGSRILDISGSDSHGIQNIERTYGKYRTRLKDVTNIYDQGVYRNLIEVLIGV